MIRNKLKRYVAWGTAAAGLAALTAAVFWQGLTVEEYTETTGKIGSSVRIAVITDLHDTSYGEEQKNLIRAIGSQDPTWSACWRHRGQKSVSRRDGAVSLGDRCGVSLLLRYRQSRISLRRRVSDQRDGPLIRRHGSGRKRGNRPHWRTGAPALRGSSRSGRFPLPLHGFITGRRNWQAQFDACRAEAGDEIYTILLSHRPELTEQYRDSGFDLVLAGHAHGGQVRIPGLINGLFAPDQGFFPSYAGGRYTLGETVMIVSRGLCRNAIPRVFNPPELVIVDLEPEK
jgi:predicted MPP superfamily phosphohydrolase